MLGIACVNQVDGQQIIYSTVTWLGNCGHWCLACLDIMPKTVVDLLAYWKGQFGRHCSSEIWKMVPLCIISCGVFEERTCGNSRGMNFL